VLIATSMGAISPFFSTIISLNSAFGDGLTQEQITASLGNRQVDLLIKLIPTVVTTETIENGQEPAIEFRLFDSSTNQSFSHVTYYIIVEKDGKRLLYDLFHDHDGNLKLNINPTKSGNISVSPEKTPLLAAWIRSPDKPVTITGPIFATGGLYHFIVRIETVDTDNGLLPDDQKPIYDSWLSIGSTENHQIDLDGKQIPVKLISYYDKLNDFGFDAKNMQMKFDMPFNWNVSRLENSSIFVHEEIFVPKPNAFTVIGGYTGSVNGINISKNIMLDNSNPNTDIIHVMLPKNDLLTLATQVNKNEEVPSGIMNFTLQPSKGSIMGSIDSMSASNSSMAMGNLSSTGVHK
jgi:hypothetical protein